ncbi:MAG: hypothetical protein LBT96_05480 [Campylobacteraceae bacterium]|jgi:hypothetical protein|nr:hypothetical protein [Campylobacteraceae bacterium]
MRFKVKILSVAIVAGLFCNTLAAAEDGFVGRVSLGFINIKEETSNGGSSSASSNDGGGIVEIYGGYRMQNLQFGLSYAVTSFIYEVYGQKDYIGATGNQILASGAFVFEDMHDKIKPFLGLGLGWFTFKLDGDTSHESGIIGAAIGGVNVEFDNLFFGIEVRERLFGGADANSYEVRPQDTYMAFIGYKF